MSSRTPLQPMLAGEIRTIKFDFLSDLAVGETISTQVVTASVYSGTDATPSSLISGSASAAGSVVSQLITTAGKTTQVLYELLCTVTTSAGQTLKKAAYLPLTADLP